MKGSLPEPRIPWINKPDRGRMPRNEFFSDEPEKVEVCPYCRKPLTKQYMYFSYDLGHNIKVRDCVKCGVTLYQQPKSILKDVPML